MTACRHRWRLAPPEGPTSPAVCSGCGATRSYPNTVLEYGATLRRHPLGVPGTLPTRGWQERLEMIGTVNTFRRADFEVDWADVNGDPRPYVPWWDTEEGSDGDV